MSITVKNLHKDLAEDQLHEAKGFTTASNNTYLKKNHEGSSEWLSEYWLQPVLGVVTGASAPPTESSGDRYILTGSSFDAGWDSPSQHEIVEYNGTSWIGIAAVDGMRVVDLSNDSVYYFNTAWNQVTDAGITGIGDTLTSATQGSILFAGASGVLAQDNTNLFWDDSNNRLGIGTNSPAFDLHVLNSGDLDTKVESNGGHSRFIIDSQDTDDSILQFNENNNRRWSIYTDGTDDKLKITRSDVPTASPTSDAISIDTSDNVSIPNGTLTINDYTFPSADGSASQVLQTDGNGALTFATVSGGSSAWTTSGSDIYYDSGKVGIGLSSSFDATLHIKGAGSSASTTNFKIENSSGDEIMELDDAGSNIRIGLNAGDSITSGSGVIAIGENAGTNVTSNSNSIMIGKQAGQNSGNVANNIYIGENCGQNNSGTLNVSIGSSAGRIGSGNNYNVSVGYYAMYDLGGGDNNTALGYQALGGTSSSNEYDSNVAIGYRALWSNTTAFTGDGNIGIGANAGDNLTSGSNNIIIGKDVDASSATVSNELRIGNGSVIPISADLSSGAVTINGAFTLPTAVTAANDYVLTAQTDGSTAWAAVSGGGGASDIDGLTDAKVTASSSSGKFSVWIANGTTAGSAAQTGTLSDARGNLCIGGGAGKSITSADYNVFLGQDAGDAITTGGSNIAIGAFALSAVSTNPQNTAVGYAALQQATGQKNTAVGSMSMQSAVVSGSENSGLGVDSLKYLSSGQKNAGFGNLTLYSINTGSWNASIGYRAGYSNTSGGQNVYVGAYAGGTATDSNQMSFGYNAQSGGANTIQMGNSSISTADIQVSWTVASDERVKDNITDTAIGLDFINALRPVTFTKIHPADYPTEIREDRYKQGGADYDEETEAPIKGEFDTTTVHDGLIAQEVKATMDSLGVDFSGWKEKADGRQGIQYEALVMPLIKAVQELSAKVEALENA